MTSSFCPRGHFPGSIEGQGSFDYLFNSVQGVPETNPGAQDVAVNSTYGVPALLGLMFSWEKIIVVGSTTDICRALSMFLVLCEQMRLCIISYIFITASVGRYYLRRLNPVDFRRIFQILRK